MIRSTRLALLAAVAALGSMSFVGPASAQTEGKFTAVTDASGVTKIMDDKYAKDPKYWLSGLYLIDLDGDNHLDLVTGAHGGGQPIAMLGDGKGHFTLSPDYGGSEIHVAFDINEDGLLDLQKTNGDGGGKWWINESTPGHLKFRDSGVTAGQGRQNAMIDINKDGKVDWLHERPGITWELGDGTGHFKAAGSIPTGAAKFETNVYYGDLRGTGNIDLVVHWGRYENEKGQSRIFFNDGQMNFKEATEAAGLSTADGVAIKGVGDVNQDGFPDLMVLENKKPEIYLNDGKGHFTKKDGALNGMEAANKPAYVSWGLATVTDFDNDGVADILWNGRNFLWVLRGNGDGTFTYMDKQWSIRDMSKASVDDGLCFGDIDEDGALDIVGYTDAGDRSRFNVYHNDLPKQHWVNVRIVGAAGHRMAPGSTIRVTDPGTGKVLWNEQVQVVSSQGAHSYYSFGTTERHFGLGQRDKVDVSVTFYPSGKKAEMKGVAADKTVVLEEK